MGAALSQKFLFMEFHSDTFHSKYRGRYQRGAYVKLLRTMSPKTFASGPY